MSSEVVIDNIGPAQWEQYASGFADYNLYQTWAYGSICYGQWALSHLVLKKDGAVAAIAQVRILKWPLLGGIAYMRWGPCWKLRGRQNAPEVLREMASALRDEYAVRRGLFLRVLPNELEGDIATHSAFEAEGYQWKPLPERTFVIDLTPPLDVLRKRLNPRWRTDLNAAQRKGLTVVEGTGEDLYEMFASIYNEMRQRKGFVDFVSVEEHRYIQDCLPEASKMKIMVGRLDNEPVTAAITSLIGETAHAVLWATTVKGRETKGAYLLQWRVIEWLKAQGCRLYDLCGIDRERNPGSYRFKAGLVGANGREAQRIGQYEACQNPASRALVRCGDLLRLNYRQARYGCNKIVQSVLGACSGRKEASGV
jgi:lipid II:glycine glycyltransferase (peptidoglycan interpeptide bridge formation enzyme)